MTVKTIVEHAVMESLNGTEEEDKPPVDPNKITDPQVKLVTLLQNKLGKEAEAIVLEHCWEHGAQTVTDLTKTQASAMITDLKQLEDDVYKGKKTVKTTETLPKQENATKPTAEAKVSPSKPQTGAIIEAQTRPNILPSGNMVKKTLAEAGKFSIIEWPDGGRQLRKHSYDPKTKEAKDYHIPLSSITDYLEAQCVLAQTSRVDVTVKK